MIDALVWSATDRPSHPGWYVFRERPGAPLEVVHAFELTHLANGGPRFGQSGPWPPCYSESRPARNQEPVMLFKRMHLDPTHTGRGLAGEFLVNCEGNLEPINLSILALALVAPPDAVSGLRIEQQIVEDIGAKLTDILKGFGPAKAAKRSGVDS